jgi:hypothetical protein
MMRGPSKHRDEQDVRRGDREQEQALHEPRGEESMYRRLTLGRSRRRNQYPAPRRNAEEAARDQPFERDRVEAAETGDDEAALTPAGDGPQHRCLPA